MVKILDCTSRDGGFNTNWNFDFDFIKNLIYTQNQSGVEYFEIGYRNYTDTNGKGQFYRCEPLFLKTFYDIKENIKLGVMVDTKRYNENDFPGKNKDYIDFVRVACHPNEIKKALNIIINLYDKGYKVFLQLMEIYYIDIEGFTELFNWNDKKILTSLYLADTDGILNPGQIESFFNKFKMLGYTDISFHAHNANTNALNNTLIAIKNGAYSVDVSLSNLGRNGGNLDAELLLDNLPEYNSEYYKELSKQYSFK